MEYLLGIPAKVERDHLILETRWGAGLRIWTSPLDEYSLGQKCKIFVHSDLRMENNTLVRRTYGFLREGDSLLFSLLLRIRGIGPKTSLEIVANSPEKIVGLIREGNLMALMSLPGLYKYAKEIMDFFRRPKNKCLLEAFGSGGGSVRPAKRREILEMAADVGLDPEAAGKILDQTEGFEAMDSGVLLGKIVERLNG